MVLQHIEVLTTEVLEVQQLSDVPEAERKLAVAKRDDLPGDVRIEDLPTVRRPLSGFAPRAKSISGVGGGSFSYIRSRGWTASLRKLRILRWTAAEAQTAPESAISAGGCAALGHGMTDGSPARRSGHVVPGADGGDDLAAEPAKTRPHGLSGHRGSSGGAWVRSGFRITTTAWHRPRPPCRT